MKNILSRLSCCLCLSLLLFGFCSAHAQDPDVDYLKHGKVFNVCSFKKDCSHCYECGKERYIVKLNNKVNKGIKKISYKYYSEVYNRIITKEAQIKGDRIDARQIGLIYICVPMGQHWVISEIEYTNNEKIGFILHDRMENYIQEPDECDCND